MAKKRSMMTLTDVIVSAEEKKDADQFYAEPSSNPDAYIRLLRARQAKALKAQRAEKAQTTQQESTMSTLDKFNRKRDSKILALWQERQRQVCPH